jgi:hypothetical protein
MKLRAPDVQTPQRPAPDDADRQRIAFLRSYLLMRTVIGLIGTGLPVILLVGDWLFVAGDMPRGSLSAYYHTGMRDVFVGSLFVIGVFLITYMLFTYNWDNVLSMIAGAAALAVAIFPTGGNHPLTPLQERLGERTVSSIHQVSAAIFILSLAVISFLFGQRERRRPDRSPHQQVRGKALHWACGLVIIAAVVYMVATKLLRWHDAHSLFYGETVSVLAFGLSWLMKGLELEILLHGRVPAPEVAAPPAGAGRDTAAGVAG